MERRAKGKRGGTTREVGRRVGLLPKGESGSFGHVGVVGGEGRGML